MQKNETIQEKNNSSNSIVTSSEVEIPQKEKSSAKKEKDKIKNSDLSSRAQSRELNPTTEEVKTYFLDNNFPELEAQKFFNYFSSIGWLVGGKTPMVDWQAAAQNWILNSINFNHNTDTTPSNNRQNLNATTDKNYAEPL